MTEKSIIDFMSTYAEHVNSKRNHKPVTPGTKAKNRVYEDDDISVYIPSEREFVLYLRDIDKPFCFHLEAEQGIQTYTNQYGYDDEYYAIDRIKLFMNGNELTTFDGENL